MIDRRDILLGSATALAAALVAPGTPAYAQAVTVPATKRGMLERPGCRIYYEVTGSGPPIIFAHGLGSNHLTWWQQVPHFSDRFTCVTFAHRGYPPGSELGVPDPKDFGGDLAALIDQLQLPDVRLVAQSMGGWTSIEYILNHAQHKVRALVLASTCGTIQRASAMSVDPQRLAEWNQSAAAARADMARRGISPPAGERMAREQPGLHFLYREIANASAAFDREELRKRLAAMATRSPDVLRSFAVPTLFIIGGEDTTFPPFLPDALVPLMPDARVEHVPQTGHSVYFQRAEIFNRLVDGFLSKVG
jgi:pimeloyl-ACP methyl ester carboxylesterase